MATEKVPSVVKQVRRDRAYFTISWSVMEGISRQRINASVPAMSGIWELYHLENSRVPRILKMGAAWLGGVRHTLRFEADPEEAANRPIRELLESGDCYYRYTLCENRDDLADVFVVLSSLRNVGARDVVPTGRYVDVRIREPEEMLIRRVRTPQEEQQPVSFGHAVPNMFDFMHEIEAIAAERVDAMLEEMKNKPDQS